jgi:hypothetical protein
VPTENSPPAHDRQPVKLALLKAITIGAVYAVIFDIGRGRRGLAKKHPNLSPVSLADLYLENLLKTN